MNDPLILGQPAATPNGGNGGAVKDATDATFVADVLDASRETPVIVDLWAPWCGPCKTLGPALENAVAAAKGAVILVKINVDENPEIKRQMQVQSIPAVYAFKDGQPVDGFLGAVPESQVKEFVQRLAGDAAASTSEALIAEADAAREAGDAAAAAALYGQVLRAEGGHPQALAGLARCYIHAGDLDRARQTLEMVPPAKSGDVAVRGAQAELSLAGTAAPETGISELEARIAANANDHPARFDLAGAYAAAGRRADAVDQLLEIITRERSWNDDAARKQLVTLFDAYGPTDEVTRDGRRRLSSLLFS